LREAKSHPQTGRRIVRHRALAFGRKSLYAYRKAYELAIGNIAWIRTLNGSPVIFVDFPDAEHVTVSVGGAYRVITLVFWRSLPIYG